MRFAVVFVCTGNICRSPVAERLFRARIAEDLPVTASSAGTRALVGYPMDPPSALALRELGGESDGHRGTLLTTRGVADADLLLSAQLSHRSLIRRAYPAARTTCFTLREFALLAAELEPVRTPDVATLRDRVAEIAARSDHRRHSPARLFDIADPYAARLEVARATAAQISEAVDAVIRSLGLARRAAASD